MPLSRSAGLQRRRRIDPFVLRRRSPPPARGLLRNPIGSRRPRQRRLAPHALTSTSSMPGTQTHAHRWLRSTRQQRRPPGSGDSGEHVPLGAPTSPAVPLFCKTATGQKKKKKPPFFFPQHSFYICTSHSPRAAPQHSAEAQVRGVPFWVGQVWGFVGRCSLLCSRKVMNFLRTYVRRSLKRKDSDAGGRGIPPHPHTHTLFLSMTLLLISPPFAYSGAWSPGGKRGC